MSTTVYVQLGWLQTAITWVYQHTLSPLFDKLGNIISAIHKNLFQRLLLPILEGLFGVQIDLFKALFMNMIYNWLFRLTRVVMWALDAVENAFRTFAGLNPVYVQNDAGVMEKKSSLLLALTMNRGVQTAILGMMMASFVLCFLTALFATIRSIGDFGGEDGKSRSVGKVLRLTMNALLRLILIPVMSLFLVVLGDALLQAMENATNAEHAAVSDILFTMSTLDAVRDDVPAGDAAYYNSSTRSAALAKKGASASDYADYGLKDKYRKTYYLGEPVDGLMGTIKEALGSGNTKKREVMAEVLKTFDIRRIDYFIAIGGTILFIYLFGTMAVVMISRIFDCLLLLMVEPFFAATMPLDEGKKFDTWQEVFLGKLISGYGAIVAMNIYLQVIALVFEGKVAFFGAGTTPAVDYLTRLFFVLMGAYAITQAGPLVTGIMSAQAGAREKEMMTMGNKLTATAMSLVTAPARKLASYVWKEGVDAASKGAASLVGNAGIVGRGNPTPGVGDAFGKMGKNGPTNVQFNGKKIDTGTGTAVTQTGTGSGGATGPGGTAFSGKKGGPGTGVVGTGTLGQEGTVGEGSGQQFTQTSKPNSFDGPMGGLDAPIGSDKPGAFDFLNQPGDENQEYTWIGQRDKEEREEREAYEKMLGTQLDEAVMAAAESETGMDLDGDGFVTGSINDVDDDPLTMQGYLRRRSSRGSEGGSAQGSERGSVQGPE
ncbi:MAG: hypothetical protein K6G16_01535 [Lachnospiraceae bacterium]|nr:hypothetical protein [Lachnospiraceae bacterium]